MPLKFFEKIDSTNEYVKENLLYFKENFSGVYTFNQLQGKGQRGNSWLCEPQKNIALTFCLANSSISPLSVSFWVAIVVRNFIEKITHLSTSIKWPNDILIKRKKICGILIEKSKGTFIIGIGINVLQTDFSDLDLLRASSLTLLTSKSYSLSSLVNHLLINFKENYSLLDHSEYLYKTYNNYLFGKNLIMPFKIKNSIVKGRIKGVDEDGLLLLELENKLIEKFKIKEIEFLYE